MIRGRTESTMDAYNEIKEHKEALEKTYNELENKTDKDDPINGDSFSNKDLERWMGVEGKTAASYTRRLDKMRLIFKDSRHRPNRHYLLKDSGSEKAGITLRSLKEIIENVLGQKNIGKWARKYIRKTDIEGCAQGVLSEIGISKNDLPIILDLGLKRDPSLDPPLYMENLKQKSNTPKTLKIDKNGSKISIASRSVIEDDSIIQEFSLDKEEDTHTKQEKSENGRSHQSHRSPEEKKKEKIDLRDVKKKKETILEKIKELDDGDGVTYMDLLENVRPESKLEDIIEDCRRDGSIYEPKPGKVKAL